MNILISEGTIACTSDKKGHGSIHKCTVSKSTVIERAHAWEESSRKVGARHSQSWKIKISRICPAERNTNLPISMSSGSALTPTISLPLAVLLKNRFLVLC